MHKGLAQLFSVPSQRGCLFSALPCCLHLNQLSKAFLCPCFWVNIPHKPLGSGNSTLTPRVNLMLKLGLTWVLCPGTATACTALSQGIVPLSHFSGEKHTGKRQTQRHKGSFFQPQHSQGAAVPLRAPHVMGTVGWSRLPPEEAILSKELPTSAL